MIPSTAPPQRSRVLARLRVGRVVRARLHYSDLLDLLDLLLLFLLLGRVVGARGPWRAGKRTGPSTLQDSTPWAETFVPMPIPKTVCRTIVYNKIVQLEVV